ncbi:MAG: ABC transporter permease [Methylobacteriaceae bacterium]|nr:ABC transporter permease [Methylobacteriaceae bacterium]
MANSLAPSPSIGLRSVPLTIWRAIALPLLLLVAWQLWAMGLPADTRAPSPAKVLAGFVRLTLAGDLPLALIQSIGRVVAGFLIALVLGLSLGLAMGRIRWVRDGLEPIVESFRPIAPMAILPIAILFLGTGTPAALSIVAYAAFFPLLLNVMHGVSRVDPKLVLAARTMGVPPLRTFTHVILPAAMPSVLLGSRLAMGSAWTAIIAAELAVGAKAGGGTSGGIGQMMFVFYAYSIDLNGIVVCMIVVGVVALLIDRAFRGAERILVRGREAT